MKTGKNGGRPKKETIGFQKNKTNGFDKTETKTKPNENVNDNENVNVNDNENVNDNASDSCVDGLQKVISFYNENIGLITPYGIDILTDYAKEMSEDLIILAMKKSVEADKRTIQYIKAILNNWTKAGIKTVIEAEKEDKRFKQKDNKSEKQETAEEQAERYRREWGLSDDD